MSTTLIFVRHGESQGNKLDSFNGSIDHPLTDRGRQQAECTAKYLDRYKIDAIYSSDLSRAYETASFTAKRQKLEIAPSKNLREIYGGKFEGLEYRLLEEKYPVEYGAWRNDMGNCRCPGGESVRELLERVNTEVLQIAKNNIGKTVLIATHAAPIRAMSTVWAKKDITKIRDFDWVTNASVTVVNYDDPDNPEVILYDEHAHLADLSTALPSYI